MQFLALLSLLLLSAAHLSLAVNANANLLHMDGVSFRKCPSCFHAQNFDGTPLPQFWDRMVGEFPGLPRRTSDCAGWEDKMALDDWQDCGDPGVGMSNSCLYLNVSLIMKNQLTETLAAGGGLLNSVLGQVGSVLANPSPSNILDAAGNVINQIPGVDIKLPPWLSIGKKRRKKRSVLDVVAGEAASVFSNVLNSGQLWSNANNPLPTNGEYKVQMYYKGCVRQSMLETLAASHCKLHPQLQDIKFFAGQTLMKPLMDMVAKLNNIPALGIDSTVEGLCYMNNDEGTPLLWNGLFGYENLGNLLSGKQTEWGIAGQAVDFLTKLGKKKK